MSEKNRVLKNKWTIIILFYVAVGSAIFQIRGPLLTEIQSTFDVSKSILGLIAPAGTVGFLIAMVFSGLSAGKLNIKKLMLISLFFNFIGMVLVSFSFSFFMFLGLLFGRGAAAGIFRGLDRPIMTHLYSDKRGWILSMHTLLWSVGAATGPVFVNLILPFIDWLNIYLILSVPILIILIFIWNLELPKVLTNEEAITKDKIKEVFKHPIFLGVLLVVIINGGIEGSFFIWLPYYVNQFFSRSISNYSLSIFLLTYIPGRFLYGYLSDKLKYMNIILFNTVSLLFLFIIAFILTTGIVMLITIFIGGFLISGTFPLLLAKITDIYPENSGPINAIVTGSSIAGISTVPVIVGVISDVYTIRAGMQFLIPLMLTIILVLFVVRRKNR